MPEPGNHSFLVVRLGSLGDLVHTLPSVAALRSSFPDARIDWVVDRRWSPLIELVAGLDHVIPLTRSIPGHFTCIRRLRSAGYRCVIDFQGLYKSALLARFSGAVRRIGFDGQVARERGAAWFYTDRVIPEGRHVAEMNLSLALRAGAKQPSEMRFPIRVPQNETCRVREKLSREGIVDYVLVSPGGGWRSKCWPAERYGELCVEMWNRHGLRAVVNVGPGEEGLADGMVRAAGAAKPFVVQPPLLELAALLVQARLVVAADTGPLHLAAALGAHVVGLFGPTDPARNGPLPHGMVVRNVSGEATTYKRGREYSPAMLSLTVDQVVAAAEQEMGVTA